MNVKTFYWVKSHHKRSYSVILLQSVQNRQILRDSRRVIAEGWRVMEMF